MKQTTHPNFILGLVSLALLIIGALMYKGQHHYADYVLLASLALGGIHWIWSIIDVFRHQNNASQSRVLWVILVVVVPPLGGLMYYAMSKTVRM
ncbi:MAG: hypothetical protein JWP27_181 [Flaviaesturariibacter sp.]|nr:hypothetical protein [Flaviaesturariibacter sp.]